MTRETELIEQGVQRASALDFPGATAAFEQAHHQFPAATAPRLWLARMALLTQDTAAAEPLLDGVFQQEPESALAWALKGLALLQREEFDAAAGHLARALELDPGLRLAHLNLGTCLRELDELEGAEACARRALELGDDYGVHFELGATLVLRGLGEEGLREILKSIEMNPLFVRGYLALGEFHVQAGQVDLAVQLYRLGLGLMANVPVLREKLCDALSVKYAFAEALEEARLLVKERGAAEDHLRVGEHAVALGDLDQAREAFLCAQRADPAGWRAAHALAELHGFVGQEKEAEALYEQAIQRGPADAWEPWNGLGLMLLHRGQDPRRAGTCFLEALERSPGQVQPLFNLALTQAVLQDQPNAARLADQVVQVTEPGDPLHAEAQRLLAALASGR